MEHTNENDLSQVSQESSTLQKVAEVVGIVLAGLLTTALVTLALHTLRPSMVLDNMFPVVILTHIIIISNVVAFIRITKETVGKVRLKFLLYAVNTVLSGFSLVIVPPPLLINTAIHTALLIIFLVILSNFISFELSNSMVNPLCYLNILFIIFTTYLTFFKNTKSYENGVIEDLAIFGGFTLFSGQLICNIHRFLIHMEDPMFRTISIAFVTYINIMNLFSRVIAFSSRDYYIYWLSSELCEM